MNIKDNPDLLQKLMQDMDSAPEIYRPTPYWQGYVKRIHDRIKNVGLVNFRDDWEISKGHGQIRPVLPDIYSDNSAKINILKLLPKFPIFSQISSFYTKQIKAEHNLRKYEHDQLIFSIKELLSTNNEIKNHIEKLTESSAGIKEVYDDNMHEFTLDFITHLAQVFLLNTSADIYKFNSIIEIGGGHGKFAEIILKLSDSNQTYCFVDIPPVLYIATEYLRSIFPDRIIDYSQAIEMSNIDEKDIKGKILVIPPWLLEKIDMKFDFFWNSASFQEMEKNVISSYLDVITSKCNYIGINSLVNGHIEGAGGQKEPITLDWISSNIIAKNFKEIELRKDFVAKRALEILNPGYDIKLFKK